MYAEISLQVKYSWVTIPKKTYRVLEVVRFCVHFEIVDYERNQSVRGLVFEKCFDLRTELM